MHEQNENFDKEIENIKKKKQILELKSTATEMKNWTETSTADSVMQKKESANWRQIIWN